MEDIKDLTVDNITEENINIEENVKEQTNIRPVSSEEAKPVEKEQSKWHSLDIWGFIFDAPRWNIKIRETEILFSGDVSEGSMLELIEAVDKVYDRIEEIKRKTGIELPLRLVVNSPGGSVKAGFMAIDYIKSLPIRVESYVLGQAASMGFMLWLVGDKRDMYDNASILIHQIRAGYMGRRDEFEDYMKHLNDLHNQIVNFVVKTTGLSKSKVEELFSRETWLNKQEAKKLGLIT